MSESPLSCFKAYDVRGEIGVNIDEGICYRIGRAVAQHLSAKTVVVGYDARETSPLFSAAVARGLCDAGADVLNLGLCGTEEMYWAVTEFGACAGIEVTASHNPINYNGMKIVKSGSRPLDPKADFQAIEQTAREQVWFEPQLAGTIHNVEAVARERYVDRVLSFIDVANLRPLRIVVNSGNGAAGPTFDALAEKLLALGAPFDFLRVHHEPNSQFPNGIPNPMLPENHAATSDTVKAVGADFGVAFDGDFDRCFLFDGHGKFVPGEYVVGLLASFFLAKEGGAAIVHDPRVIWNTIDVVNSLGGVAVQSKTGHAFVKDCMRLNNAVYGGEISAHHYFRDFAFCDSGMIPWLLISDLISQSKSTLEDLVAVRSSLFPSSGELNFVVDDPDKAIDELVKLFGKSAQIEMVDGASFAFETWRFNIRKSNTEPLVRLNVESRGSVDLVSEQVAALSQLVNG